MKIRYLLSFLGICSLSFNSIAQSPEDSTQITIAPVEVQIPQVTLEDYEVTTNAGNLEFRSGSLNGKSSIDIGRASAG